MWNLLAGDGGMVSIGQQAFFGLGGYMMLSLGNFARVNPFLGVLLGALVAGLVEAAVAARFSSSEPSRRKASLARWKAKS